MSLSSARGTSIDDGFTALHPFLMFEGVIRFIINPVPLSQ